MPTHYVSNRPRPDNPTALSDAEHDRLAALVRDYEALRTRYGPERDRAERALEAALARYGEAFRHDGRFWQWSEVEGSITRRKAQATNHPHGRYR